MLILAFYVVVRIQGFENVYLRSPRGACATPPISISQKGKIERLLHRCNISGYNGSIPYFLCCLFLREKWSDKIIPTELNKDLKKKSMKHLRRAENPLFHVKTWGSDLDISFSYSTIMIIWNKELKCIIKVINSLGYWWYIYYYY